VRRLLGRGEAGVRTGGGGSTGGGARASRLRNLYLVVSTPRTEMEGFRVYVWGYKAWSSGFEI